MLLIGDRFSYDHKIWNLDCFRLATENLNVCSEARGSTETLV